MPLAAYASIANASLLTIQAALRDSLGLIGRRLTIAFNACPAGIPMHLGRNA